jgi:mono/diheme cytochrome c family protein
MPIRRAVLPVLCGLLVLVTGLLPGTTTSAEKPSDVYAAKVQPLLKKYCFTCHEGAKPKGGFRLDTLSPAFSTAGAADAWEEVRHRVAKHAMPPKKSPQPEADEARVITRWIAGELAALDDTQRKAGGRVVLRRLNRIEYQNTMRDLFGVDVDVKEMLPEDATASGFDNVGSALRISDVLLQRYLDAARATLDEFFFANAPVPPAMQINRRVHYKDEKNFKDMLETKHVIASDDAIVLFRGNPGDYAPFEVRQAETKIAGRYRYRLSAAPYQSGDKPITVAIFVGRSLVGYFDVPRDEPNVLEFVSPAGKWAKVNVIPYRFGFGRKDYAKDRGLALRWLEVEGPLPPEKRVTEKHRQLLGAVDLTKGTLEDAERILRGFLPRAFRRPLKNDDELRPFVQLVAEQLDDKVPFDEALRAGLEAVLLSPDFLFLVEKPGKLDDYALASRLSYFLWSTMPDDELLWLAARGTLHEPGSLRRQVERMLHSPQAAAFTENFLGQWLDLRQIDATTPDRRHYPEHDELLRLSMVQESHAFFEELLKNDLPVQNFIDSDFTMLNRPLGSLYDIKGVEGLEMRRVNLPPASHRGGLMGQAAVLKVTANGSYTSPVLRGVWVLKNILGQPPKPPPPEVPAIEPDIRGAVTIRQQLAKHRTIESCAACHNKIDPPGFALENYDVIGRWRDNYRTTDQKVQKMGSILQPDGTTFTYRLGQEVDAADELPSGKRFRNIDEFKKALLEQPDQIARCLTEKLLIYGTGATVAPADRLTIEEIVQRLREKKYGLRTLVHEVVQSKLFLNK